MSGVKISVKVRIRDCEEKFLPAVRIRLKNSVILPCLLPFLLNFPEIIHEKWLINGIKNFVGEC